MELNQNLEASLKENVHNIFVAFTPKMKTDVAEILSSFQDDRQSKLSIGTFFEFMKTAYEVNNTFEDVPTMINSGSTIDWNKLKEINLNFSTFNNNTTNKDMEAKIDCIKERYCKMQPEYNNMNSQLEFTEETNTVKSDYQYLASVASSNYVQNWKCLNYVQSKAEIVDHTIDTNMNKTDRTTLPDDYSCNESKKILKPVEVTENILSTLVKKNLSDILHEGLLDSILPYMIPKSVLSQPVIKKSITNTDIRKTVSLANNVENKTANNLISQKEKEKDRNKVTKKTLENEVEIHVCDEEKNMKKNFRCPQKLLIQKMCYFADVTAGQKLEDIDISVHCDVVIFDWLMRWVKKDIIKRSEWPVFEASNVIPIMVSASFLQMEPLLQSCIEYCYENMSDVLKTSTVLTCLDDNLLTRLADRFSNEDVEMLKDKRDKIQSKLFCKLIISLAETTPDNKRGHYSSLSMLFKCSKCGKNIIQSISDYVPCIPSAMKIDQSGIVHSKHVRDLTWTLNDYILALRAELRSWRKVYWRLWGDCHFIFCQQCEMYFPIHQMDWCCYHPELPQFFINEQQRPIPFPLGRYPCCSQRAYRFEALPSREGCRYKEHLPEIKTQRDINVLNIFAVTREIIAIDPPQLFFPEKITRLVARDPSLQPGKLVCKETMWWAGIELVPQRPKLGLLGKIWSGLGSRRFAQLQDSQKTSRKFRQSVSVIADTTSPASSPADSDDTDGGIIDENSSADDVSYSSEESTVWTNAKPTNKDKRKSNNLSAQRCWSGNLNIRHNQDNQRDFEEKAATQMTALLTKRIMADSSLMLKPCNRNWKKNQPAGGTYVKLEFELREQLNQSYKYKNSAGKGSVYAKMNRS